MAWSHIFHGACTSHQMHREYSYFQNLLGESVSAPSFESDRVQTSGLDPAGIQPFQLFLLMPVDHRKDIAPDAGHHRFQNIHHGSDPNRSVHGISPLFKISMPTNEASG